MVNSIFSEHNISVVPVGLEFKRHWSTYNQFGDVLIRNNSSTQPSPTGADPSFKIYVMNINKKARVPK